MGSGSGGGGGGGGNSGSRVKESRFQEPFMDTHKTLPPQGTKIPIPVYTSGVQLLCVLALACACACA